MATQADPDDSESTALTQSPTANWFFYILRCADDSLYSGITTDLERRLREHNADSAGAR
jgi:predicted GIY-YIG superfamily endonuclease